MEITFDSLPHLISDLNFKVDCLIKAFDSNSKPEIDRLLTLSELQNYLPEHPAKQTVYGWISNRLIPVEKHGKRCYFRKSSIDRWLQNGRQIINSKN